MTTPNVGSGPTLSQTAAADLRHPLSRALLALTFTTGVVDAVSYLGLGHVFAANMTGNIVLLGFGIAGGTGLPVVAPIVALIAFLFGAGFGGTLVRKLATRHAAHMASALTIEAGLLAAATLLAAIVSVEPATFWGDTAIALLAFGMGVRNATIRKLGVPDLTTTVLTLTLTGLAADSHAAGGTGNGTARRIAATSAMLAGALVGALLLKMTLFVPLLVATALTIATWTLYVPWARRQDLDTPAGRAT
jgi:uncharacterized membrane protein YoaK (UPF0700 family)